MFKRISSKILSFLPHILALLFIFAFAAFAWQEPSQAPPQGNAPAPINVSNTDQSKLGGLGLGGGVGQALQWLKNIGGTLHIQNQAGTSNLVIGQDGKVGIGITGPETKLDVVGTLKATGFKMPTDAEAGKVLTSDASGAGTWKTPAPGSSTLVNYGYYNGLAYNCNQGNTYACYTGLNPCPTGWTEANVGHGAIDANYTGTGYRTCFRADKTCLVLVNYGYYNGLAYNCNQGNTYACYTGLNPCPTGWTEANVGHGALGAYYTSTGYRTCFLCQ